MKCGLKFKKYMHFENVRTFESLPFLGCIAVLRT